MDTVHHNVITQLDQTLDKSASQKVSLMTTLLIEQKYDFHLSAQTDAKL